MWRGRENCVKWEGLVVVGQQEVRGEGSPSVMKGGLRLD